VIDELERPAGRHPAVEIEEEDEARAGQQPGGWKNLGTLHPAQRIHCPGVIVVSHAKAEVTVMSKFYIARQHLLGENGAESACMHSSRFLSPGHLLRIGLLVYYMRAGLQKNLFVLRSCLVTLNILYQVSHRVLGYKN
jgi:hypothetical protein